MALDFLLQQVKDAVVHHTNQQGTGFQPDGLLSHIEGLFGSHQKQYGSGPVSNQYGNVRPASEDPNGDPGNQRSQFRNVRPASEDPLGDPAG